MAGFMDKKEEILKIILTEHGRRKLAKGEFIPKYYSFMDSDVDYQPILFSQTGSL